MGSVFLAAFSNGFTEAGDFLQDEGPENISGQFLSLKFQPVINFTQRLTQLLPRSVEKKSTFT
jgi:hypothetical protein